MNRFKEDAITDATDAAAQPKSDGLSNDGIDRRNFLGCMAWAGTGLLWTLVGGVPSAKLFGEGMKARPTSAGKAEDFSFVQISDSHIGFNKGANPDVTGTLTKAIERAGSAAPGSKSPDFLIHTGDITQNSKPAEFDTASGIVKSFKGDVFYVPGEHDYLDDGTGYKERFGKATAGTASTTKACILLA